MPRIPIDKEADRARHTPTNTNPVAVTVYCGASPQVRPDFLELAHAIGRAIAAHGWELVYGGGGCGLMGACAEGALSAGGRVTGITTAGLEAIEPAHPRLSRLEVVDTMHRRKMRMTELGYAFLVLPGGFGTLDETFEALTWRQLGIHEKPVVLLNHEHYFDPLLAFARQAVDLGFVSPAHLSIFHTTSDVGETVERLAALLPAPGPLRANRVARLPRAVTPLPGASHGSAAG